MGFIRGKIDTGRKVIQRVGGFGDPIYRKCECGKWLSVETGKHIEVEVLTLSQMMEKYGQKCPDTKEDKGSAG